MSRLVWAVLVAGTVGALLCGVGPAAALEVDASVAGLEVGVQ